MSNHPKIHPDECAYAFQSSDDGPVYGLTKREYFAAMAMQGTAANRESWLCDAAHIAAISVEFADALIAALNGGERP